LKKQKNKMEKPHKYDLLPPSSEDEGEGEIVQEQVDSADEENSDELCSDECSDEGCECKHEHDDGAEGPREGEVEDDPAWADLSDKDRAEKRLEAWKNNRANDSKSSLASRSGHYYGKQSHVRQLRRRADRHSHHRRRNHVRNQIAQGNLEGTESVPPPSSSKRLGRMGNDYGHSQPISNRKLM
jgi:hypothetical protein